jgi:3-methyladenine DNA glycosylase Mpg
MKSPDTPVTGDFYYQNAETPARNLPGCILVHETDGRLLSGRIVETEAHPPGNMGRHRLFILSGELLPHAEVSLSPRIGLSENQGDKEPRRWYITDSRYLSSRKR